MCNPCNPRRRNSTHLANILASSLAICTMMAAPPAAYALSATPTSITFESLTESKTITIEHNGAPVAASDINEWRLLVDEHDYNHMLDVREEDGGVVISPSDAMEIGSFQLAISTTHGDVAVAVYTPLRDLPDSLANRAEAMGISVEELRKRVGITQSPGRERIELQLPPVLYAGQKLRMNVERDSDRTASWTINGTPVQRDFKDGHFEYLFPEPGIYVIAYTESKDGKEIASGYDVTSVIGEPPVRWSVIQNASAEFTGPVGFKQYRWIMDGMIRGNGPTYTHVFDTAGEHELVVRGYSVDEDGVEEYREVTYHITVS